jgi:hypothetical protein
MRCLRMLLLCGCVDGGTGRPGGTPGAQGRGETDMTAVLDRMLGWSEGHVALPAGCGIRVAAVVVVVVVVGGRGV